MSDDHEEIWRYKRRVLEMKGYMLAKVNAHPYRFVAHRRDNKTLSYANGEQFHATSMVSLINAVLFAMHREEYWK